MILAMIGANVFDTGMDAFEAERLKASLRKTGENFREFNYAMSGIETGSNLYSNLRKKHEDRINKAKQSGRDTALDLLLADTAYRQTYEQTHQALVDSEALLHNALVQSSERLNEARKALSDAKDTGASADEIKRLKRAVREADQHHDHLLGYDSELQAIRDHMQDKDNPPSQEELDGYKKRIGEISADIEQHNAVHKEAKPETEISSAIEVRSSNMDIPTI